MLQAVELPAGISHLQSQVDHFHCPHTPAVSSCSKLQQVKEKQLLCRKQQGPFLQHDACARAFPPPLT